MKNKIIILVLLFAYGLKAQTGGPGQPEFMQFQQAGTSDLVNPSTGSFSYQIPLFTIGGYPMNLTYQSGIQMEDVSSMVGLGWNLNAGSVVRTLRGLQDDFKGDIITKKYSVKPNETYGGKISADWEIAGMPKHVGASFGAGLGVFYNNYKGWGIEPSLSASISGTTASDANKGNGGSASLGMGMSANSQNGVDKYISPSVGLKLGSGTDKLGISLGKTWSVNSNEGLKTSVNSGLSYTRYSANQIRKGNEGGHKTSNNYTDQSSASLLGFSTNSYLNNTFQPDIDYPFENTSGTYSGTLGWDSYYVDPNIRVSGYYSKQKLTVTSQDFGAYGAMYETSSIPGKSLMDFNTEKKLPYFIGESKILPIPFNTPDVFNLNAQGLSMTFSVLKNDIGIVGDPDGLVTSNGNQAGAEVNLGALFKAGANFGTTVSSQSTMKWNWGLTGINFKPNQTFYNDQLYQQFCFKNHGEINKFDHTAFSKLGGYEPIKFNLADESVLTNVLHNGEIISPSEPLVNKIKPVMQSGINYLTAKEATNIGFDKYIKFYKFSNDLLDSISRVSSPRLDHHLSEMSIVQPDGRRYVFGIPVYNLSQKEASFNVSGNNPKDFVKNLIKYTSIDNSEGNQKGIDHFFESMTTPAYATQFLITAVLNTDYRDLTNNGISNDDFGNYVKFTYYKDSLNYKWRTPFAKDMATFNRGLRSDDMDDRGTYVYGEKELWYVRSIESKTEISMFYYSDRQDGFGVMDENGGIKTDVPLKKLDSIIIYSLRDYQKNGSSAAPIKTIHFDYSYKLCKGVENSSAANTNNGKLTLDQVYFTYEKSQKGKLTPYVFDYGKKPNTQNINPNYSIRSINRWGYYQADNSSYSDCDDLSTDLSNIDSPYSSQNKTARDDKAYAWNLTDIKIPGSGKIKVDYEANDYAYIQDKTAGQMFKVTGVSGTNNPSSIGNTLYDNADVSLVKNRIYFNLTAPMSGTTAQDKQELKDKYIKDITDGFLYYKMYVMLTPGKYEYITGYAKVKNYGVTADHLKGYLDLEPAYIDDENPLIKCNPILRSATQFMRINRNGLLFGSNTMGTPSTFESFITSLPNILGQVGNQIAASSMGVNLYCETQNYCNKIVLNKSFIRLYNPIKKKIAGGSRVKQVSIDDNWDVMSNNAGTGKSYTTRYEYTAEETDPIKLNTDGTPFKITISSGVAEYEPLIGGDEISLKQPIFYSDIKRLAPDNDYYVEDPINESLFPAPQIIYGKVTQITNGTTAAVAKTGKVVNEFFTAKDYPVKVKRTIVDQARNKTEYNPIQPPFIAIDQQHDFAGVSQGFSIELNNMSGLAKATWVYNENGVRVSGEESKYFDDNDHFTLINKKGKILNSQKLGLTVDYTVSGKRSYDKSVSTIYNANFNLAFIGLFPFPMIMPLYSKMTEERQFQSIVVNKVIHRNALLKSKTIYEQSSCVTTENLAFDEVTGEAILSKMDNEFNDSLYSFNYPAYWMYRGMGPSSENTKLLLINLQDYKIFLKVGDELRSVKTGKRIWVRNALPTFEDSMGIVTSPNLSDNYQIYTSGAKNLLSSSAGKIVTWNQNPIKNKKVLDFDKNKTLNSSATEYFEHAVIYCESCPAIKSRFVKSDFLSGKKGNFQPNKNWFFLTDRTSEISENGLVDIRTQGLFSSYNDFWKLPKKTSSSWTKDYTSWEWKEKVNLKDSDGQPIETEDRIGRKTTNLIGYKNTLITAQADNAGYGEVYSDGFEDYYCAYCPYDTNAQKPSVGYKEMKRVKRTQGDLIISSDESHSGKYSLKVSSTLNFTVLPPVYCKSKPLGKLLGTPCIDCIGGFYPEKNKKYVFSCWVKVNNTPPILSCSDASVVISATSAATVILHSEGAVIDGWQRVMGTFDLEASNNVLVKLSTGSATTYFDDLRIFPADANMNSYVYDDNNLRITYSLDENNYFTKNEYNNQGELIRIKKETEKGIIIIKEGDSSIIKTH